MNNIVFICQSLGNGGAERVVSILANELVDHGYGVYVLAMTGDSQVYKINNNIRIMCAGKLKKGIQGKLARIREIRRVIIKNRINTVIAFSHYNAMYSVIAASGLNVKVIGSERNDPGQLRSKKLKNFLRTVLYKRLDYLVCQTNDAKAYFPLSIQKKTVVIMNPIVDNLPAPYKGKRERKIVSFSRLEPQKNIPMLIDAFEMLNKEYPDYFLEIYGNGNEKNNLKRYIREKQLEKTVNIFPFIQNIHDQVISAAMFILASDYEGLSNAMIEAMAIGLPTVVTDCPCGGARMVINNGENGLLVPVGDAYSLYKAMKCVIEKKAFAEKLSMNGRKIREQLDKNKIIEAWINLL